MCFEYVAHVETGQASEERFGVAQMPTSQGICHQDSSLISQVLSDLPEITYLHEASLTNIVDILWLSHFMSYLPVVTYSPYSFVLLSLKIFVVILCHCLGSLSFFFNVAA